MINIHSLSFDYSIVDGWHHADNNPKGQGWLDHAKQPTKALTLEFEPDTPPVPPDEFVKAIEIVRQDRRQKANADGMCLLEHSVITSRSGLKLVRVLEKKPMQPHGMAYLGSFTLLDLAFFRIQLWCFEVGPTGLRDAMILNEFMGGGTFNPESEDWGGWWIDPHGFGKQTPVMQNVAEDEKYDSKFPDHPLSQVRSYMQRLADSLEFDPMRSPPPTQPKKGNWLGKLFGSG